MPEYLFRLKLESAQAKTTTRKARNSERNYELRGNNLAVQDMTDEEILLVGPAGTGKTLARLMKMNRMAWEYPRSRQLIVRKVRADLAQSTLVTFERDVLGEDNPICLGLNRENRHSYRYPNGSEIVVGGMDRPGRVLSADYDSIYPAEAVQFTLDDWEMLLMRLRTGVFPYQQIFADTNPDRADHWLKQRCDAGMCKLLNTWHTDNPRYWNVEVGEWTEKGRDYVLGKLGRLSGVRRARYVENKWVSSEGAVYEAWSEGVHVVEPFEIPRHWRRIRAIDFGFVNPFVCLWLAEDPVYRRIYVYRQLYMSKRRVAQHAIQIKQVSGDERYEISVADHDAEDRDTLKAAGIDTIPAKKDIGTGIQAVQELLEGDENGPRLFVFRDSLVEVDAELIDIDTGRHLMPINLEEEFPGYMWAKTSDGKPNKEVPVDLDNHALDAVRYGVMYLTQGREVSFARATTRGLPGRGGPRRGRR